MTVNTTLSAAVSAKSYCRHEGEVLRQPEAQSDVADGGEQPDDRDHADVRVAQARHQRVSARGSVLGRFGVDRFGLAGRVEVIDERGVPLLGREPPVNSEDHDDRDREEQERQPPVRRTVDAEERGDDEAADQGAPGKPGVMQPEREPAALARPPLRRGGDLDGLTCAGDRMRDQLQDKQSAQGDREPVETGEEGEQRVADHDRQVPVLAFPAVTAAVGPQHRRDCYQPGGGGDRAGDQTDLGRAGVELLGDRRQYVEDHLP